MPDTLRPCLALLLVAACGRAATWPPPPGTDVAGDPLPAGAIARIGTARFSGPCAACAFSADEKSVVAGCDDGVVTRFDAETGRAGIDFPAHRDVVQTEPEEVAACAAVFVEFPPEPNRIQLAAFSPDGTRVATVGGRALRLFDIGDGRMLAEHVLRHPPHALAFSPDERTVRVAANVRLWTWDPAAGTSAETALHFDEEGFLGMLGDGDAAVVRPWRGGRVPKGAVVQHLATGAMVALAAPYFAVGSGESPDGSRIAILGNSISMTGVTSSRFTICDATTGAALASTTFADHCTGPVAWSPDGSTVAVAGSRGVLVTDAATLSRVRSLHVRAQRVVRFSSDGSRLLVHTAAGPRILDLGGGADVGDSLVRLRGHGLRWSADGRRIAAPREDGRIGLFDATSGAVVETRGEPAIEPPLYALDAEGRVVLVPGDAVPSEVANQKFTPIHVVARATGLRVLAYRPNDEMVAVRDLDTQREFRPGWARPFAFALSPSGRRAVICATPGFVVLDDVDSGASFEHWSALDLGRALDVAVAEDLNRVVLVASSGVFVLEVGTPNPIRRWKIDARWARTAVAISDDGRRVAAVAGWDVVVWDVDADEEIVRLAGHRAPPGDLAFSPDGTRLVTSSADGTALVWALPAR